MKLGLASSKKRLKMFLNTRRKSISPWREGGRSMILFHCDMQNLVLVLRGTGVGRPGTARYLRIGTYN
jgi:hypothetical protein